jgi:hypothetical protein
MSDIIRLRIASAVTPGAVGATEDTVCYGSPAQLTSTPSTGGSYTLAYQWQQLNADGSSWSDVTGGTGGTTLSYTTPELTETTKYRLRTTSGSSQCETAYGEVVTVTVLPQSILNYPDLRIRACPVASGGTINLSKYLDTVALKKVVWNGVSGSPAIDASTGIVNADKPVARGTYTYTYTVTNPCVANMSRKVYLKILNDDKLTLPQDTIMICYEKAEAVQINQIFGIDAGGKFEYFSPGGDVSAYITTSAAYGGAVIMDGKGIYENTLIGDSSWHGISVKIVEFTYTPDPDSCLGGKEYKIVIILHGQV